MAFSARRERCNPGTKCRRASCQAIPSLFGFIVNGDFSFSPMARLYLASPTTMNICSLFASMERRSRVSRNLWIRSTWPTYLKGRQKQGRRSTRKISPHNSNECVLYVPWPELFQSKSHLVQIYAVHWYWRQKCLIYWLSPIDLQEWGYCKWRTLWGRVLDTKGIVFRTHSSLSTGSQPSEKLFGWCTPMAHSCWKLCSKVLWKNTENASLNFTVCFPDIGCLQSGQR